MPTGIPYLDEVINPTGWGCYGPGGTAEHPKRCTYCFAAQFAHRGLRDCPDCRAFVPHWHPEQLDKLSHWKRPRRIGVQFMGDLFGSGVSDDSIWEVFKDASLGNRRHTYLFLTKEPARMRQWFAAHQERFWHYHAPNEPQRRYVSAPWPDPQFWLGVTAENQAAAGERIPLLLQTSAAVRFVSVEPMLGPLYLEEWWLGTERRCGHCQPPEKNNHRDYYGHSGPCCLCKGTGVIGGLSWVIIGADSMPGAQLPEPAWVESLIEQCRAAKVPAFVKGRLAEQFPVQEYPK